MKIQTPSRALCTALSAFTALSAWSVAAFAAGGIKAAYVEEVIPAKTFAASSFLISSNTRTTGPGANAGVLGISSITITNFDSNAHQVWIYTPTFSNPGSDCSGTIVGGVSLRTVYVQARSTLHMPFPTPLVINPSAGLTCVAAQVTTINTGSVEVDFIGVLN